MGQRWFLVGARVWLHEASNGPCMSVLTLGFWLQVVRENSCGELCGFVCQLCM